MASESPQPETTRTFRGALSRLTRSRAALVASSSVVVLAVAGTTLGYSAIGTDVTLALDGQERQVEVRAETVGDVLAAEGIEVGEHDLVVPSVEEEVVDGTKISVQFGRPLQLSVDGEEQTYWVTSTEVASALGEIGQPLSGARLSTSRSAPIGRGGMELEVVTPKTVKVKIADRKMRTRTVTALTVEEALDRLGVRLDKRDQVRPGREHQLEDGDRIVFTDIRVVTRKVRGEAIAFETVERTDDSMFEGEDDVVRDGRPGSRDVVYRLTFRNGELVVRKVVSQRVLRNPVARVVAIGTKERPVAPAPAANYASGGTVWDALAKCESGGNWAINTGNGYYGGLQFSLSTWQAYGGPGYPHQQSRETQIAIAEKVRAATGGYGSWPHCSQQLGLPQ